MSEIKLTNIPDGHIVAGHIVVAKVLDEDGKMYWATRMSDLNDMECIGMLTHALDNARSDLVNGRDIV